MSELCRLLAWDSRFFGVTVARVTGGTMSAGDGRAILDWCASQRVRLLYFLADDEVATWAVASDSGFRLVDVRVELVLDGSRPRPPALPPASRFLLREATESDLEPLLPIAASAHTDSRFFADPSIPWHKAGDLFALWLRRSVEHAIADIVFVAEVDARAVSYITAKVAAGVGSIGLVGVGEGARGHGIGPAMVERAVDWCLAHGAASVSVVTQGRNTAAQRLYQRCGFVTECNRLWYHRWFP